MIIISNELLLLWSVERCESDRCFWLLACGVVMLCPDKGILVPLFRPESYIRESKKTKSCY